ncbi:hypothetical protein DKX38_017446 [Salix brachista]|uniref:Alcohol dehydrogenase-like C-terminal domain-containing protein n=1 Tax=Salix brachista TaxID=2182728 RepID=A0A5N5KV88_9ROSI|nr:hypothetical protein DKX38_017446 [Salix brachista]
MPRPKAGEVLIKTKACGVCHSDLHVIKGEIPFPSPCAIGHEITGEVLEHGKLSDRKTIEREMGHDDLCEDFFAYNRSKGTLYDGETRLFLRNSVRPGDSVAVIGVGGVGSSCLQIARAFGASDIIAVDVQDEKLEKAKTFGATATINSKIEDPIERIKFFDLLMILRVGHNLSSQLWFLPRPCAIGHEITVRKTIEKYMD